MGPVATNTLEGGDGQLLPGGCVLFSAHQDSPRPRLFCVELGLWARHALP